MTGNDVLGRIRQPLHGAIAFERVADVEHSRKDFPLLDVLVVMARIRREHNPTALRVHPHALQAGGVSANAVNREAGGELIIAVVKLHAAVVDQTDHADHVFDFEAVPELMMAHMPPRDERHLVVLKVEARLREIAEGADVVVVHVRHDHIADRSRIDAKPGEAFRRPPEQHALALRGDFGREACIQHERAIAVAHEPHEVIHRHRRVVRIAAEKMIRAARIALCVFDREDFIRRQGHGVLPS